jgi:hypothetical protein
MTFLDEKRFQSITGSKIASLIFPLGYNSGAFPDRPAIKDRNPGAQTRYQTTYAC